VITLASERAAHTPAIERLLDDAFGPERWQKTCQRLRDGQAPLDGLSLVALADDELVGTVRLWPIVAGGCRAALLGPLAVDVAWRNHGIGGKLMRGAARRARESGERAILLVGDAPYYGRFGFTADLTRDLRLPGPVDPARFLARELVPGALAGANGFVVPDSRSSRRASLAA
jgi:predicted N-acetyltransferase YhbS